MRTPSLFRFRSTLPSLLLLLIVCGLVAAGPEAGGARAREPLERELGAATQATRDGVIDAIDTRRRVVVFTDADGRTLTLRVANKVARLDAVKPGERVLLRFLQSTAISLARPSSDTPPIAVEDVGGLPVNGPLTVDPLAVRVTAVVEILRLDTGAGEIGFLGPAGFPDTLVIDQPRMIRALRDFKVGDLILISFIAAVAVHIEPIHG